MEYQGIRTQSLRLQIGGGAVLLLSLGALAALMTGMPSVAAVSPAPSFDSALAVDETKPLFRAGCEQCAVVTSIRVIEPLAHENHSAAASRTTKGAGNAMTGDSARRYEVTVRMRDGSTRVIEQARPASWQVNERLILIGAADARSAS